MNIEVTGTDQYGNDAYGLLFEEIMSDIGKATMIDHAILTLQPEVPLFITSLKLKAAPSDKVAEEVCNIRAEGSNVHITITDERYAALLLNQLWKKYGRESVNQQTRFDLIVENAKQKDVSKLIVASGDESMREIIGAIWRSMPEGIKNRKTMVTDNTVTIVATEELLTEDMIEQAKESHKKIGGY